MNPLISAYKELIVRFVDKKEIGASKFETEFLKLFKSDKSCDENFYKIIKPLFYAVEDFCPNPEIRDDDDLDENQLAEVAKETLDKLDSYEVDDKNLQNRLIDKIIEEKLNRIFEKIDKIIEEKLNRFKSLEESYNHNIDKNKYHINKQPEAAGAHPAASDTQSNAMDNWLNIYENQDNLSDSFKIKISSAGTI